MGKASDFECRGVLIFTFGMLLAICEGCTDHEHARQADSGRNLNMIDRTQNAAAYKTSDDTLVLKHDFGMLKPGEPVKHRFTIHKKLFQNHTDR